jgi:hypothetical protein
MRRSPLVFLVLAVLASACDNGGSTTTTAPTTPAADPTQTDTFTGTLAPLSTNVHLFSVTVVPGNVNVTLTQAGPPSTITVGLGAGVPDGLGGCTLAISVQATAGTTPQIPATVQTAGQFCISVVELGNAAAPITYTVTVAHP